MKSWFCLAHPGRDDIVIDRNTHQAMYAALMPYRLPEHVLELLERRVTDYYVRIGRGPAASPEIYSSGPGYLLSAGGCGRRRSSSIVARPTVLLLEDRAQELGDTFHIPGSGPFTRWNNTGVLRAFAVGSGPVSVPQGYASVACREYGGGPAAWCVYEGAPGLLVAVLERAGFGIIVVFSGDSRSAPALADALMEANPKLGELETVFRWPGSSGPFRIAGYDLEARAGTWVIRSVDGRPVDRSYDRWPRTQSGSPVEF